MKFFIDNWFLFLTALVSGGLLAWPKLGGGGLAGRVSPAEAVQLINRDKAVLIDVCEPAEYAAGHAAGAKSVPLGSIDGSPALPKNKALPVVLICASGARASRAAAQLKKAGYERAHVLAGGLKAWREANLPTEKSA
ncbi:rhodanese-like domain-containing protein [Piscinibacter sp.]|uniref:rhodanese-like domain-containing protein n=1 Tax=Piscinibacter sp. TaxID=1903157 RepID=UPI0039E4755F